MTAEYRAVIAACVQHDLIKPAQICKYVQGLLEMRVTPCKCTIRPVNVCTSSQTRARNPRKERANVYVGPRAWNPGRVARSWCTRRNAEDYRQQTPNIREKEKNSGHVTLTGCMDERIGPRPPGILICFQPFTCASSENSGLVVRGTC